MIIIHHRKGRGLYPQEKSVLEATALLNNYKRFSIDFEYGKGVYLYDKNGNQYLDFLCGIAVTGFGHSHPVIKQSVEKQLNALWHVSNLFESSLQESLADKLIDHSNLSKVFFCNSGTEANEAAIKFARKFGGEMTTIISAEGSFHGRTMGSLSASAQVKLWNGFRPLTPGFKYVPFDDSAAIKNSITEDVCAIMLEPIQGENGIIVPSNNYLKQVAETCDEFGLLLILDEVQTGLGRTGKIFAHQWFDLVPDIITTAKGIANGLPLGAVIVSQRVADVINPGDHGSTFGGNPVSISAANTVVDLLTPKMLSQISDIGIDLMDELLKIKSPIIKEIRGMGLMIGIEFGEQVVNSKIVEALLDKKIITYIAGRNTVRLLPPYLINSSHISQFLIAFKKVIQQFEEN